MKEKNRTFKTSLLESVPSKLPALMRAYRISERAAKIGFDWQDIFGVLKKVEEEWIELKTVLKRQNRTSKEKDLLALEFGDVLFTLVNVARFAQIHPETALRRSTNKFEKRFRYMEKCILNNRRNIESFSLEEMDALWEEAKEKIG
jgi:MazG family protein